jgi:hypothetical protein
MSLVPAIVDTIDGKGRPYVAEKMAERYAVEIVQGENKAGEQVSLVARSDQAKKAAIDKGLYEVVRSYLLNRIEAELATLWSEGVTYVYDKATPEFETDLADARKDGSDVLSMMRIDGLSVVCNSAAGLIQVVGGKYNYQPIRCDCIWIPFADTIIDDGTERAIIETNIDEATCVIVQVGKSADRQKNKYAAWYGVSDTYERGRFVQYEASAWYEVPDVGNPDATEYIDGEDIANPLSTYALKNPGNPEYPIITWLGSSAGYGTTLLICMSSRLSLMLHSLGWLCLRLKAPVAYLP